MHYVELKEIFDLAVKETVGHKEQILMEYFTPMLGQPVIDELLAHRFCHAPASTVYHGNHEGGLFEHSLAVAYYLQKYTEQLGLKWKRSDSPVRIGLLHDLCKIDAYTKKAQETGSCFEHNSSPIVKGHGDKSVIYALMYGCQLTDEEVACIIYHMGAYETSRWDAFDNAIKTYPNVLYTHTADMAASKIMGV